MTRTRFGCVDQQVFPDFARDRESGGHAVKNLADSPAEVFRRTGKLANLDESERRTGFRSFKRGICGVSRIIRNCAVSAVLG